MMKSLFNRLLPSSPTLLQTLRRSLLVSFALLSGACGAGFQMHTAPDFIVLNDSAPYDYRATTAEGVVIGVRELDNETSHAELSFWTKAIENELRLDQGYALLNSKDVATRQGIRGKQLRFGWDKGGEAHLYIVSVFATDARIYLLEAGGSEALVKRHQKQIDWSVEEFIIR